ncbi:hypothetical protein M218_24600 [Burkholderia pseudomallei MSHR338]|uniref:hypothetical protein n=1 Tax=Burkholderia pseudomallei TaxID=28450 RepID=UPI0001A420D7|nr:hypothetical protein [Burkholderia pseudomallei]EEP50932.1 conserved hypothetical protein [Burkholderia pseudomallei MSHR346]EQA86382.1 hypothetical protein M218_24600 [Burkholderia pseudomallei MSHR338]OMW39035.1 hypothetical protein AQ807_29085 [Burkholderia pseudomallei]ONA23463.1 hypothetical protein AQ879_00095 [Burkholderia pseudomallei]ONA26249.1 hypothetical protein AQ880_24015 [Burkholderia pseudomallei]
MNPSATLRRIDRQDNEANETLRRRCTPRRLQPVAARHALRSRPFPGVGASPATRDPSDEDHATAGKRTLPNGACCATDGDKPDLIGIGIGIGIGIRIRSDCDCDCDYGCGCGNPTMPAGVHLAARFTIDSVAQT